MDQIYSGIDFFQKGGFIMYILLLCSIFVVAIGVERVIYFSKADSGRDFAKKFYEFIVRKNFEAAINLTKEKKGDLVNILSETLHLSERAESKITSFMEIQSGIALSQLRRRLYYLKVIVTLAPLLGLLGTISGMISAFSVFNVQAGQVNAITGGVGEALIATAMGLCVAILALVIHAYFIQRIENIVTDMEQCFSLVEFHYKELSEATIL